MYVKGKIDEKEDLEGNVIVKVKEDPCRLLGEQIKLQIKRYFVISIFCGFLYNIVFDDISNIQIEIFTLDVSSIMISLLLIQIVIICFNQYEDKFYQIIGAIMGYIAGYFIFSATAHDLLKFEVVPFYNFYKTFLTAYILLCLGFSLLYQTGTKIPNKKSV